MRLQGKLLQDVTWEDLQALVDLQVRESPTLEYKEALPGWRDGDKKELLADVSAFANSSGGVLLYGVPERRDENGRKTDAPESLQGIEGEDDVEVRGRIDQIIRAGLDPPLLRCDLRTFPVPERQAFILAIGVPQSLLAPHAVSFDTRPVFWRRAGSAKYGLRTSDLRQMFLERDGWELEAEAQRQERLALHQAAVVDNQDVSTKAAMLLQVLPLGRSRSWVDLSPHWDEFGEQFTFGHHALQGRMNFDGLVRSDVFEKAMVRYAQWFRTGGVELFATFESTLPWGAGRVPSVDAVPLSIMVVEYAHRAMSLMDRALNVGPPYGVLLSILHVRQHRIEMIRELRGAFEAETPPHEITKDALVFPAVLFDELPADVQHLATALRPVLDAFWQSGGIGGCRLFDPQGNWKGRSLRGWEGVIGG